MGADRLLFCGFIAGAVAMTQVSCSCERTAEPPRGKHVLLLGASVGRGWRLSEYTQRVRLPGYSFESVDVYQFDKSEALEEILIRPRRKFHPTRTYMKGFFQAPPRIPDIIILKECAAYFPGDLQQYEQLMRGWVRRIQDAGLTAAVATVVPVTRERNEARRQPMASIRQFNAWLREFAHAEGLPLLDLARALEASGPEGFLRDDLTSGDGLHLNQAAYALLDQELPRALGLGSAIAGDNPR